MTTLCASPAESTADENSPSNTTIQSVWDSQFFIRSPLFAPFGPYLEHDAGLCLRPALGWPQLEEYNRAAGSLVPNLISGGGSLIRFVRQAGQRTLRFKSNAVESIYQLRIFLTGEVSTRAENWHDYFNMLTWIAFPKSKAALNRRSFFAYDESAAFPWRKEGGNRCRELDLLTLVDEGGAVVACADPELWELCQKRRWKELFWEKRERCKSRMGVYAFGHALYEVVHGGHPTPHASGVMVPVSPTFFTHLSMRQQLEHLDSALAGILANRNLLRSPRDLSPIPLLGFPGLTPHNESAEYYEQVSYFRTERRAES